MEILRQAPDRVTRLALISVTPLAEMPDFAALREGRIVGARSGRLAEMMANEVPVGSLAPGAGRADIHDRHLQMAETFGLEALYCQTRATQRRRDQQSTLRRTREPILILCGAYDTIYPVKRHGFRSALIPYSVHRIIETASLCRRSRRRGALGRAARLDGPAAGLAPNRPGRARPAFVRWAAPRIRRRAFSTNPSGCRANCRPAGVWSWARRGRARR